MNILGNLFAPPRQDEFSTAQMLSLAINARQQQLQDERAAALAARQEANYNLALRRQGEAERRNAAVEEAKAAAATLAALTSSENLTFEREKYADGKLTARAGAIDKAIADGAAKVEQPWGIDYRTDSAYDSSRARVAPQLLAKYMSSQAGMAAMRDSGMSPEQFARSLLQQTDSVAALANESFRGTNNNIEKTFPAAFVQSLALHALSDSQTISDPIAAMREHQVNRHLSEANPNGMLQALAVKNAGATSGAESLVLNPKSLQQLSDMYNGDSVTASLRARAAAKEGMEALATTVDMPVETIAAFIANNPEVRAAYIGHFGPNGDTNMMSTRLALEKYLLDTKQRNQTGLNTNDIRGPRTVGDTQGCRTYQGVRVSQ